MALIPVVVKTASATAVVTSGEKTGIQVIDEFSNDQIVTVFDEQKEPQAGITKENEVWISKKIEPKPIVEDKEIDNESDIERTVADELNEKVGYAKILD